MKLAIDPHGDDLALFASYTCIAERPLVVITHPTVPSQEITAGLAVLGCMVVGDMNVATKVPDVDTVYAPAFHDQGHDEHNEAAAIARAAFPALVTDYLTYGPRGRRDRGGKEVLPGPGAVAKKLRALSCYESQIEQESTRPWFTSLLDLREWLA